MHNNAIKKTFTRIINWFKNIITNPWKTILLIILLAFFGLFVIPPFFEGGIMYRLWTINLGLPPVICGFTSSSFTDKYLTVLGIINATIIGLVPVLYKESIDLKKIKYYIIFSLIVLTAIVLIIIVPKVFDNKTASNINNTEKSLSAIADNSENIIESNNELAESISSLAEKSSANNETLLSFIDSIDNLTESNNEINESIIAKYETSGSDETALTSIEEDTQRLEVDCKLSLLSEKWNIIIIILLNLLFLIGVFSAYQLYCKRRDLKNFETIQRDLEKSDSIKFVKTICGFEKSYRILHEKYYYELNSSIKKLKKGNSDNSKESLNMKAILEKYMFSYKCVVNMYEMQIIKENVFWDEYIEFTSMIYEMKYLNEIYMKICKMEDQNKTESSNDKHMDNKNIEYYETLVSEIESMNSKFNLFYKKLEDNELYKNELYKNEFENMSYKGN